MSEPDEPKLDRPLLTAGTGGETDGAHRGGHAVDAGFQVGATGVPAGGRRSPIIVLVAAIALVGLSFWKPWVGSPSASPGGSTSNPSVRPTMAVDRPAGGRSTPMPVESPYEGQALRPRLMFAGLDLSTMGLADGHRTWGVSAATVLRPSVVRAVLLDAVTVTPTPAWSPSGGSPGARPVPIAATNLTPPGSITVALAVTWPHGIRPSAVRLLELATPAPMSGGSGKGRPARLVPLSDPLPAIVRTMPDGVEAVWAASRVRWPLESGTFFLPPVALPDDPAGWLTAGWEPGDYEFRVTLSTGTVRILRFRLGA